MNTIKQGILLVAVVALICQTGCGGGGSATDETNNPENLTTNVIALHTSSSDQYRDDCLSCHSDILTEESLSASVPTAHNAMLPETTGDTTQEKCVFCHQTVDILQGSAGNLRRQVNVETCNLCHGAGGSASGSFQYYQ